MHVKVCEGCEHRPDGTGLEPLRVRSGSSKEGLKRERRKEGRELGTGLGIPAMAFKVLQGILA